MPDLAFADLVGPGAGPGFNNGYEWIRERMLEDGIAAAEIATVTVHVPGIWCDMGPGCVNGPGGHWRDDACRTPG